MTAEEPPLFPSGEFTPPGQYDAEQKAAYIEKLFNAPNTVRQAVEGLSDQQLDTKYKNWTIRQIVHHLADSHMNAFIRFKWALTEDKPLIKAYDETAWSEVIDCKTVPVSASIDLLLGLHLRWAKLVESLTDEGLERTYFHPEIACDVLLSEALPSYVWHTEHHVAQINWLRKKHGWG